jgi:hypothetical protein
MALSKQVHPLYVTCKDLFKSTLGHELATSNSAIFRIYHSLVKIVFSRIGIAISVIPVWYKGTVSLTQAYLNSFIEHCR